MVKEEVFTGLKGLCETCYDTKMRTIEPIWDALESIVASLKANGIKNEDIETFLKTNQ
jgi:hypothetical protein